MRKSKCKQNGESKISMSFDAPDDVYQFLVSQKALGLSFNGVIVSTLRFRAQFTNLEWLLLLSEMVGIKKQLSARKG